MGAGFWPCLLVNLPSGQPPSSKHLSRAGFPKHRSNCSSCLSSSLLAVQQCSCHFVLLLCPFSLTLHCTHPRCPCPVCSSVPYGHHASSCSSDVWKRLVKGIPGKSILKRPHQFAWCKYPFQLSPFPTTSTAELGRDGNSWPCVCLPIFPAEHVQCASLEMAFHPCPISHTLGCG